MKKVCIVTGSARGIGYETAKTLYKDGFSVVLSDILPEEEGRAKLEGFSEDCSYFRCDISSEEDRKSLFDRVTDKYKRLDLLVNNAGVAPKQRMDILETTQENFDGVLNINLRGTFFMCQRGANVMLGLQKKGLEDYNPRIVNISSMSAYTSSVNRGEYCISKSAVSMITTLFADRLAGEGILVHEVRPGVIRTDMTSTVQGKYDALIENGAFPIRRWGTPEDVADAVAAFCSDAFLYTTGNYIDVDGGFHIKRL